jgi:hypothetical protein
MKRLLKLWSESDPWIKKKIRGVSFVTSFNILQAVRVSCRWTQPPGLL